MNTTPSGPLAHRAARQAEGLAARLSALQLLGREPGVHLGMALGLRWVRLRWHVFDDREDLVDHSVRDRVAFQDVDKQRGNPLSVEDNHLPGPNPTG